MNFSPSTWGMFKQPHFPGKLVFDGLKRSTRNFFSGKFQVWRTNKNTFLKTFAFKKYSSVLREPSFTGMTTKKLFQLRSRIEVHEMKIFLFQGFPQGNSEKSSFSRLRTVSRNLFFLQVERWLLLRSFPGLEPWGPSSSS